MTKERLTLRKLHEILRLKEESKLSNRAIARARKISNSTVGEYLQRAQVAGLHWPLPEELSEDELYQKLFPERSNESTPERPLPDWEKGRKELPVPHNAERPTENPAILRSSRGTTCRTSA